MARKPPPALSVVSVETPYDEPVMDQGAKKLADKMMVAEAKEIDRLARIDRRLGFDEVYERGQVIGRIRFLMRRTVDDVCEIGRLLAVVKEHEGHGGFLPALQEIGLSPRTAQQMMQAALKFADPSLDALKRLPPGKLYELLAEDTEELAALAEGGSIADLHLDAIDRLSVSELRARLRGRDEKAEKEAAVAQQRLTDKQARIDVLEENVARLTAGEPDAEKRLALSREQAAVKKLQQVSLQILGMIGEFDAAIAECLSENTEARRNAAIDTTRWLFQRLAVVPHERGWLVDFESAVYPPWMKLDGGQ